MNEQNAERLKKILVYVRYRFGLETFSNETRFLMLLSDLLPDSDQDRLMLEKLLQAGIIEDFIAAEHKSEESKRTIYTSSVSRLTKQEALNPEVVSYYLEILAQAFNWNVDLADLTGSNDAKKPATMKTPVFAGSIKEGDIVSDSKPSVKPDTTVRNKPAAVTPAPAVLPATGRVSEIPSAQTAAVTPKRSKLPLILVLCAVVLAAGFFGIQFLNNARQQREAEKEAERIYNEISISISGTDSNHEVAIEADNSQINTLSYVSASSNVIVTAEPEYLDASETGTFTVTYTARSADAEHSDITKTYEQTFVIHDTQAPIITIQDSVITLKKGTSFNPKDNVVSVIDGKDNELGYSSEDSGSGSYYTVSQNVNTKAAGVYPVTVYARDSAGNSDEVTFKVKVQTEERFVAIPSGCTSKRTDYDTLYRELEQYGNEYTSPSYSTKDELRVAIREFEKQKYPNRPCQVYPGLHITDGEEDQWLFYDYNPWGD